MAGQPEWMTVISINPWMRDGQLKKVTACARSGSGEYIPAENIIIMPN